MCVLQASPACIILHRFTIYIFTTFLLCSPSPLFPFSLCLIQYSLSFSSFQPLQWAENTASTDSPGSPDSALNPELMWIQKTQKLKVGPFIPVYFIDFIRLSFSLSFRPSRLCGCRQGCLAQSIALMHNCQQGLPLKMKMSAQWAHCHPGFHFPCDGRNF